MPGDALPADPRLHQAVPRPAPNQFQRFVQESTGRLLPVYGTELFQTPKAYGADSALSPPVDYVLGVGDEVRIQVWGAIDYFGSHLIDRSGQVMLQALHVQTVVGVQRDRPARAHGPCPGHQQVQNLARALATVGAGLHQRREGIEPLGGFLGIGVLAQSGHLQPTGQRGGVHGKSPCDARTVLNPGQKVML
jgi:hypothetical protein